MTWPHALASFFAGILLANAVPHFVHGISGDRFPTPFAHPSGKGLSSPTVNALWSLFNLAIGAPLFRVGRIEGFDGNLGIFFAGVVAITIFSSVHFAGKDAHF